ncbi:SusC/RagA family TonB-linked outer membrane protein [Muribaculum intestinale]|uniref:SusC/RagA family TonB-linked outer membrane protein n=1 Tax=Muribaculum intestinale TaxID=1796646 RepID=UPI003F67B8E1
MYNKRNTLRVFNGKWFAQIPHQIEGLTLTGSLGYWLEWQRYNSMGNNRYGQMAMYGGNVTQQTIRNRSINLQFLANYARTFNDVHNIDVLLGYESYDLNMADIYGRGETIFSNDNYTLSNVIDNLEVGGTIDTYATRGYFGRVNYDYDSKYFASVSYRRDASSRFTREHRWGNFWSVSAAWDLANESFMDNADWMDMFKIKASFGQQGNDNVGNYYPWADQYQASGSNGLWSVGPLYYKGNPDLTWETSNSFNVGVDFAMFNSRLLGTLEYFSRQTKDMLYYRPTASSLGYDKIPMNIGSMRNSGLELDLTYQIIRNKNIDWTVSANVTYIRNKVLKLAPELNGTWIDGSRIYKEGKSMYQIYTVKYAGVDPENGNALYWARRTDGTEEKVSNWSLARNGDAAQGYVENRQESGNLLPPVYGGVSTNIKVYGFDFGINCGFQAGGKMVDYSYQLLMYGANNNDAGMALHKDILNAWTPENRNTDVPALAWAGNQATYVNALSDRWLISSNYFTINNITAGYTLPKKVADKLCCSNIRVYFSGDNLYLWSKRKGLDPRQGYATSLAGSYSALRAVSGGVKIEF